MPIIDLAPWFDGDAAGRAQVAAAGRRALCRQVGFMLVTGHGVPRPLAAEVRVAAAGVLRAARIGQAALRGVGERPGLAAAGRRGQRLLPRAPRRRPI